VMRSQVLMSKSRKRVLRQAIWLIAACFLAVSSAGPALAASKTANPADPYTQVYFIRGFLGIFSTGFDSMAKSLAKDKIRAEVHGHLDGFSVRTKIARQYAASRSKRPVILVGHSFGGNAVFQVAAQLRKENVPVALVISVDPTRTGPLSDNVKAYVNYFFSGNGLGSKLKARSGVPESRIRNIDMRERGDVAGAGDDHWTVTNNPAIRREIMAAIKRAL